MPQAPVSVSMRLVGGPTVIDVHDGGGRELPIEGEIVFFVEMTIPFYGSPVDSARILNNIVLSWVDARLTSLDEIVRPHVLAYLSEYYPEIDPGDLVQHGTHLVWYDQVDYMACVDEKSSTVHFSLEVRPSLEPL